MKPARKVLIVGASTGIGRELALNYVKRGDRVGITARTGSELEKIRQQHPQNIEYETFDVTKTENIKHILSLVESLGGLDLMIISAGWGEPSMELKWDIDSKITNTNVNGFVEIANWAFNYFVKQGHGQLAAISSVAAYRGSSYSPAYAASKAFMSVYLEGLAIKAGRLKKDVTVTCIEPGFVRTKMAHGGDKMFWVVPLEKAARQMIRGIDNKQRKVFISRRWLFVALAMRWAPFWLYRRFG